MNVRGTSHSICSILYLHGISIITNRLEELIAMIGTFGNIIIAVKCAFICPFNPPSNQGLTTMPSINWSWQRGTPLQYACVTAETLADWLTGWLSNWSSVEIKWRQERGREVGGAGKGISVIITKTEDPKIGTIQELGVRGDPHSRFPRTQHHCFGIDIKRWWRDWG